MPGKIKLKVTAGPIQGREFIFAEADCFIFGRSADCHAHLPKSDRHASRHHFILSLNPPDIKIRDLGSLWGTYINGVKYGGREEHETPEHAVNRAFPEVTLKNGDKITVGETVLTVEIESGVTCCECGIEIVAPEQQQSGAADGLYLCACCREEMELSTINPDSDGEDATILPERKPLCCKSCGKDVSAEVSTSIGDYICRQCQQETIDNPQTIVQHLSQKTTRQSPDQSDLKQVVTRELEVEATTQVQTPEVEATTQVQTPEVESTTRVQTLELSNSAESTDISAYEIDRVLGKGGMGAVYLAYRRKDRQVCAIKVILAKVAVSKNAQKMFIREIQETCSLRHPNIVEVYNYGPTKGGFYFAMELCQGNSVYELMKMHGGKTISGTGKTDYASELTGTGLYAPAGQSPPRFKAAQYPLEQSPRRGC